MNDDELGRAYAVAREQRRLQQRESLPSPEALQSLVDGRAASADRESLLERALVSGGADELALLHSVAAGTVPEPASRLRTVRIWWPMAAAAALVLVVSMPALDRFRFGSEAPRFRASGAMSGPQLVLPTSNASVSVGQTFVWVRLDLATQYAFEVMNDSGRTVARIVTKDTTATLPTSMPVVQRQQLSGWRVTATMPDGSQRRSELRLLRAASVP